MKHILMIGSRVLGKYLDLKGREEQEAGEK
jgi:hypothetical protein